MKKLLLLCFLVACGGDDVADEPDADVGPPGIGNWQLTITAGAGDCTAPGSVQSSTIVVTESGMSVAGMPTFQVTGTLTDEAGGTRLDAILMDAAPGPNGENGTEMDTISILLDDTDRITGTGTSAVTGGWSCSQALTFDGLFTPAP